MLKKWSLRLILLALSCRAYVYHRVDPAEPHLGNVSPPEGIPVLEAKACGQCHAEIYQEWSGSLHPQSWVDPLFQADRKDLGSPYVCAYCHLPVGQQRPDIVEGLSQIKPLTAKTKVNTEFIPGLQQEGVTCIACHLRDGALLSPYPTKSPNAPHGIKHDPTLSTSQVCKPCHFLEAGFGTELKRPLIDTYQEWERFIKNGGKESCQGCHMPSVERASTVGGVVRPGRKHLFLGHNNIDFVRSALAVEGLTVYQSGTKPRASFLLQNKTGHNFPTGEPGRYLLVQIQALNEQGEVLSTKELPRIQRVVNEHGFVERSDNTLAPQESRRFESELSPGASGARVIVTYFLWDPATPVGKASGLTKEQLQIEVLRQ